MDERGTDKIASNVSYRNCHVIKSAQLPDWRIATGIIPRHFWQAPKNDKLMPNIRYVNIIIIKFKGHMK